MSDKLNIEQLVSSKFAEAEITPSQGAWKGIQQKLRWRQFLRFNPAQFNIYYLAGLIVVASSLVVLLTSRNVDLPTPEPVESTPKSMEEVVVQEEKPAEQSETQREYGKKKETSTSVEPAPEADVETATNDTDSQESSVTDTGLVKAEERTIPALMPVKSPDETVIENHTLPVLESSFTSSVQSGCAPLEVRFFNQSINADTYSWSFGMDDQSTESDPIFLFEEAGSFTVTLKVEDHKGQSAIHTQTIEVYPVPVADLAVDEGFEGIDGHVALNLLNYSSGANEYRWNLLEKDLTNCSHWASDEFQPSLKLSDIKNGAKNVSLIATNEFGCIDTIIAPLPVMVASSDEKIKFATAFSPNPTGPGGGTFSPHEKRIDLFHPIFLEVPVEYHLKVYTKRGELVFETRDVYQGWDGYFHEERSAGGVYVWMLEGTWLNGETFRMQGDVTLIWQDIW